MREQGADHVEVDDGLVGHGCERVTAARVRGREVRATVAAEVTLGDAAVAVRAHDQRRCAVTRGALPGPAARTPAPISPTAVRLLFAHAPPLFRYVIHAVSSAAASMLPQPVAKSQPGPAS